MARIAGINIPPHQHAEIGLTAIFGIGRTRARQICEACGIAYSKKVKDLSDAELEKVREAIGQFTIVDHVARFTYDGRVGYGLYEHMFIGPFAKYGMRDRLDGAA